MRRESHEGERVIRMFDPGAIVRDKIHVTFFKNQAAQSLTTEQLTLEELAERVRNASAREKSKLPWLKLARFGTKRSGKNCLRIDANVLEVTGCELDYDLGAIAFDKAVEAVKAAGISTLLYTSANHSIDNPRWRILAPTSRPLRPEMRTKLLARLNGFLQAKLAVDKVAADESHVLSQAYLYGWVSDKPRPDHQAIVVSGSFIDERDDLAQYEAAGAKSEKADTGPNNGNSAGNDNAIAIDWATVSKHLGWLKSAADLPANFSSKGKLIVAHSGNLEELKFDLGHAGLLVAKPYKSWSEVSLALAAVFKADGRFSIEQIAAALLADLNCNRHVNQLDNEADRRRSVERSIIRSYAEPQARKARSATTPEWREQNEDGSPRASLHNARLAITALGVECSHDIFHHRLLFGFKGDTIHHALEQMIGEVTDNGVLALRQLISDTFGFDPTTQHTYDAVITLAEQHRFDPVLDMLAEAETGWDKTKRLDRMAADYLNCEDIKINTMFARKMMIAAVTRARRPGCKFDCITVLESREGYNKSGAWQLLAGEESFSEAKIIGSDTREVQEQLGDVWIHENADLSGLSAAQVEDVKNFASRQSDDARPAYGRLKKRQKRRSIEVGTTNDDEYLQSQTGNRRFWPMRVLKSIDLEKLQRDRMQLWGEAAHYQSEGESLVLPEALWVDAGIEQEARRVRDPWEDILNNMERTADYQFYANGMWHTREVQIIHADDVAGVDNVFSRDVLEYVLKIAIGHQNKGHSMRLAKVMKHVGWYRPDNGNVTINKTRNKGYYRFR